jgi:hypothetical protein
VVVEVHQLQIHKDIKTDIEEVIGIVTQEVVELLLTSLVQDLIPLTVELQVQVQPKWALLTDGLLLLTEHTQGKEEQA